MKRNIRSEISNKKKLLQDLDKLREENRILLNAIKSAELKHGISIEKIYLNPLWVAFNDNKEKSITFDKLKEKLVPNTILELIGEKWEGTLLRLLYIKELKNEYKTSLINTFFNKNQQLILRIHYLNNLELLNGRKLIDNFKHIDLKESFEDSILNANEECNDLRLYYEDRYYLSEIELKLEESKGLEQLYLNTVYQAMDKKEDNSFMIPLRELFLWLNMMNHSKEDILDNDLDVYNKKLLENFLDQSLKDNINQFYINQYVQFAVDLIESKVSIYLR